MLSAHPKRIERMSKFSLYKIILKIKKYLLTYLVKIITQNKNNVMPSIRKMSHTIRDAISCRAASRDNGISAYHFLRDYRMIIDSKKKLSIYRKDSQISIISIVTIDNIPPLVRVSFTLRIPHQEISQQLSKFNHHLIVSRNIYLYILWRSLRSHN